MQNDISERRAYWELPGWPIIRTILSPFTSHAGTAAEKFGAEHERAVKIELDDLITIDCGYGIRLRVPPGTSVLDACLQEGLGIAHACGGDGRCTTCRVCVEEGLEHCPAPCDIEGEALAANGLESPIRLACQLRPEGDVQIRILIPSHEAPDQEVLEVCEEDIAVLFTDIRGFTTFAESHLPFDVCTVLNRYFDAMGVNVERHGGIVKDYLGDGLVCIFRPQKAESPSRRAVACALDMRRAAHAFGAFVRDAFGTDLSIGIAVHRGPAVVGEMGYFRSRQFNAVGDVLNVASRLEDLNKECRTDILISEVVAEECADLARFGRAFELTIRGRAAPVKAMEVLGRSHD